MNASRILQILLPLSRLSFARRRDRSLPWNQTAVPAGTYFIRLEALGEVQTAKLTLTR